ncbi:MAG: IS30 family transposase [Pseudorhodobacter sp. PARRP1]|nr:MAG: IS30 family transposase [Pseudorhodobacter sp. PARRP1]
MPRSYAYLSLEDRRKIDRWHDARMPVLEIAERLGRHRATIHRKLKRNRFVDAELQHLSGYCALNAQSKAEARRAGRRKLIRHRDLRDVVVDRLKTGWMPEQIAGRLRLDGSDLQVSHETIYQFAYSKDGHAIDLWRHLPEYRRRRRGRGRRRTQAHKFSDQLSIKNRPEAVGAREEFGSWEGDLNEFRKEFGPANVTSLVERVSRFTVLLKNGVPKSKPVMEGIISGLSPLPFHARRSITFDRGFEFTASPHLQAGLGVAVWFCDPQAPWQKGTNENTHGRARRYLPRDTEPTALTNRSLAAICQRLNTTPRKCLGYRTRAEVFRERVLAEAATLP